jgi:hypothetical protein
MEEEKKGTAENKKTERDKLVYEPPDIQEVGAAEELIRGGCYSTSEPSGGHSLCDAP